MSFQNGDLVYVPKFGKYPAEYVLIIEANRLGGRCAGTYSVFSLTENRKDYYNAEWLDTKAKKIG